LISIPWIQSIDTASGLALKPQSVARATNGRHRAFAGQKPRQRGHSRPTTGYMGMVYAKFAICVLGCYYPRKQRATAGRRAPCIIQPAFISPCIRACARVARRISAPTQAPRLSVPRRAHPATTAAHRHSRRSARGQTVAVAGERPQNLHVIVQMQKCAPELMFG
jgi:hypothetical protein